MGNSLRRGNGVSDFPTDTIEALVIKAGDRPDMMIRFLAAVILEDCPDPISILSRAYTEMGAFYWREAVKLDNEIVKHWGANDS